MTYRAVEGASTVAVAGETRRRELAEALAVAESDVRVFRGTDQSAGRPWATVATATAPDVIVARDRVRRIAAVLRSHR